MIALYIFIPSEYLLDWQFNDSSIHNEIASSEATYPDPLNTEAKLTKQQVFEYFCLYSNDLFNLSIIIF